MVPGARASGRVPEPIARGLDGHEGVRSAQSTLRRESRAHGEGADRHPELAQETWPEQEGSDHNANRPARQSTEGKSQKQYRFRNLYGRRNADVLRDCWRAIKKHAAYGVDRVSAPRGRARPGGQHHAPCGASQEPGMGCQTGPTTLYSERGWKGRPLGIPVVEDTRVQLAVTRQLTAISEQDFLRCRSGYRPHVGALDAVDAWTIQRQCGQNDWVVEADITWYYDNIAPSWISGCWRSALMTAH